jgi:hypothetical protein
MPLSDPPLWETIRQWPLPYRREQDPDASPPRTCASFEDNLRKRGDWTDASASRITEMYRKFLYLKALSGKPVTPSEPIDMAWHLHLEFPSDYAALCAALGRDMAHLRDLDHAERVRVYDRGRALFEAEFDRPPDSDLWPSRRDQRRALVGGLVGLAAGVIVFVSIDFGSRLGGVAGFLMAGGAIAVAASVLAYLKSRLPDVTPPSKIARCA